MFIDIERVDPPAQGIQLMNQAERNKLIEDANHLAYNYILHSGAYKRLSGEQWDALAGLIALRLLGTMDRMVDEAVGQLGEKGRK
jgi:hypothetical protein